MKPNNFDPDISALIGLGLASPGGVGAGAAALDDLTDVVITSASDGDVLTFDSGSGDWVNAPPAATGEATQEHGNLGATETLDLDTATWHSGTLDADCALTVTGFDVDAQGAMTVKLVQDGSGGHAVTWDADIVFAGDDQPGQDPGDVTFYVLASDEGDSTIYGFKVGAGGSVTYATPAIVLGTAAADGAADSVIRSDATIVAFDATAPTTAAFDDTAATGSAAYAARRDHRHGMPSAPVGGGTGGHILITDTPAGSPLVFADLLQNDAGTDLLYSDT